MKLSYNQLKQYLKECCLNNDGNILKIKAHLKGKDGCDYLVSSCHEQFYFSYVLVIDKVGTTKFGVMTLTELMSVEPAIKENSQYIGMYIDFA